MTVELWQLVIGGFAIAAVSTSGATWVVTRATYNAGYRQAADDITQALTTVTAVADQACQKKRKINWRILQADMRLVPLAVFGQYTEKQFEFVRLAKAVVDGCAGDEEQNAD